MSTWFIPVRIVTGGLCLSQSCGITVECNTKPGKVCLKTKIRNTYNVKSIKSSSGLNYCNLCHVTINKGLTSHQYRVKPPQSSINWFFIKLQTKWCDQVRQVRREPLHVELSFPPVIVITDRKRFNKMMRIITSTEQTWLRLANTSECDKCLRCSHLVNLSPSPGFLFLNPANSLLVILFSVRADSVLLVSRERPLALRMIKCRPASTVEFCDRKLCK